MEPMLIKTFTILLFLLRADFAASAQARCTNKQTNKQTKNTKFEASKLYFRIK